MVLLGAAVAINDICWRINIVVSIYAAWYSKEERYKNTYNVYVYAGPKEKKENELISEAIFGS